MIFVIVPVLFLSCKPEINFDGENYSGKNDRALYEGWDVVENDEVAAAKEAAPKKTSKDDFFALEGKIILDNDDLTAFREDSFSGHKK